LESLTQKDSPSKVVSAPGADPTTGSQLETDSVRAEDERLEQEDLKPTELVFDEFGDQFSDEEDEQKVESEEKVQVNEESRDENLEENFDQTVEEDNEQKAEQQVVDDQQTLPRQSEEEKEVTESIEKELREMIKGIGPKIVIEGDVNFFINTEVKEKPDERREQKDEYWDAEYDCNEDREPDRVTTPKRDRKPARVTAPKKSKWQPATERMNKRKPYTGDFPVRKEQRKPRSYSDYD